MLIIVTICMVISAVVAQQEGKKFLVVFPPTFNLRTSGWCQIIINAGSRAEVSIHYENTTDHILTDAGSYRHTIPCTVCAPLGHGDKGVIVESDANISVQVFLTLGALGDAYLALPAKSHGAEYIITSTDKPCGYESINNFYAVAAELDNTLVSVYAPGLCGYTLVDTIQMDSLGTYTNGSASTSLDYTGWKLNSSFPISVVSGSSCSKVQVDDICGVWNAEYIFSPSTEQAGHRFIVPKITKGIPGDSGAYVRVISFTQNNLIQLPDQSIEKTLNSGQFIQHYIYPYDVITRIECKDACIVVLYNELKCYTGEGGFLVYVTPLERSTDYLEFTALPLSGGAYPHLTNYITVIAQTENILLDGSPMTGWRQISGTGYFDVTRRVPNLGRTLESGDGGKFIAFLYGHVIYGPTKAHGYGSELVHSDIYTPQATNTTGNSRPTSWI